MNKQKYVSGDFEWMHFGHAFGIRPKPILCPNWDAYPPFWVFWLFIPTPILTSPSLLLITHPPPFRGDNWCYFHWAINTETILHLSPLHLNSLHHTAINKAWSAARQEKICLLLRVCLIVVEDFLVLRRPCKKYAFATVTENCKQKQFPRLPLSHILLLVLVDSETLK